MIQVQDLQRQLKQEQEALDKSKQRLQTVKTLKQKLNKAVEMFEAIKDEFEGGDMEGQIKAL